MEDFPTENLIEKKKDCKVTQKSFGQPGGSHRSAAICFWVVGSEAVYAALSYTLDLQF